MDKRNDFGSELENTEDFTELLMDKSDTTEQLDIIEKEKTEELSGLFNNKPKEEIHVNDLDEDFSDLVRKRDYKGKVENTELEGKHVKKRKLKKWVYYVIAGLVLLVGFVSYKIINNISTSNKLALEQEMIDNIKSHYGNFVKVTSDTILYTKDGSDFKEVGKAYTNSDFELVEENITADTKYFHIKDLDYYINYEDVVKIDERNINTRYKNYLPFNINITTKDSFTMYVDDDKYITIDKEMEFPVIINENDSKYYVEYNNTLVGIKKDDVSKTKENKNTEKKNQAKLTTLAYHKIYEETDTCTDPYGCIKKESFEKQMKYLKDNDYLTLNLDELYLYIKGYLQVEKAVAITIDDGYLYKAADEILDKYDLNGALFVVSGEFKDYKEFKNLKALEVQSHTHELHKEKACYSNGALMGNSGGKMLCTSKDDIVKDLKKSIEVLGIKPIALTYPFYDFNDTVISALKEVGIKMAFVGRFQAMGKSTPKVTDVYKIPRMTVYEETKMSFNEWKNYL